MPSGETLQSRMRLLDKPLLTPGKCAVCGAVDKKVVDTGSDLDWYGRIYFCLDCGIQIGTVFGMRDALDYTQMRLDLMAYKNRVGSIIAALAGVTDAVNVAFDSGIANVRSILAADAGSNEDSSKTESLSDGDASSVEPSITESDEDSKSKFESSFFKGSSSLSDATSGDFGIKF